MYIYRYTYTYTYVCIHLVTDAKAGTSPSRPRERCFVRESDTRCVVLRYTILLDRTSQWANYSLIGHPPFMTQAKDTRRVLERALSY